MLGPINPLSQFNRLDSLLTRRGFVPGLHPDSDFGVLYKKGDQIVYIDGDFATCTNLNLTDVSLKEMRKAIRMNYKI